MGQTTNFNCTACSDDEQCCCTAITLPHHKGGARAPADQSLGPGARYQLRHRLGSGGMATVWRAHDRRTGRDVALKLVHSEMLRLADIQRLAREVVILRNLDHPCIVDLVDTGVTAEGTPYLALELVDGITLRRKLMAARGPLPLQDVVDILGQVCSALHEAHQRGILHLDIKPENVLLAAPEHLAVKLVDFGMSRVERRGCLAVTAANRICGTPHYMSPERAVGRPASRAADVYSVAVMAYEMLCGQRPFEGSNPVEVLTNHVRLPPPPIPGLDPGVQQVLLAGLAKDPADRPTAQQLGQMLVHALNRQPAGQLRDAA